MAVAKTPKNNGGSFGSGTGKGLGKGFASLLPSDFNKASLPIITEMTVAEERIQQLPVGEISPNPHQPRHHFDTAALAELAASIKQHGVIQPLIVTAVKGRLGGKSAGYQLIAGERRWRASQLAGLKTVPAVVRSLQELQTLELALLENVQRVDLSPLEQALSIEGWHQQFSIPYEQIAKRLGKAPSTVTNIVRLLQLPEPARQALISGAISEGHARSILALKNDEIRQKYLLETIQAQGWSVRQAERFVSSVKAGNGTKDPKASYLDSGMTSKAAKPVELVSQNPATKALGQRLQTTVQIRHAGGSRLGGSNAKAGRLEITFTSDQDLARILSFLNYNNPSGNNT